MRNGSIKVQTRYEVADNLDKMFLFLNDVQKTNQFPSKKDAI